MIYRGQVFKANAAPYHRWVVLNDPLACKGQVFLVSITSLDDTKVDDACILTSDDYADLQHESTVAYSRKRIGSAASFALAVKKGMFRILPDMPEKSLQKIIEGARRTTFVAEAELALL